MAAQEMRSPRETVADRLARQRKALGNDLIDSVDSTLEQHGCDPDHPMRRAMGWASQMLNGKNAMKYLLICQLGLSALGQVDLDNLTREAEQADVVIQINSNTDQVVTFDLKSLETITPEVALQRLLDAERSQQIGQASAVLVWPEKAKLPTESVTLARRTEGAFLDASQEQGEIIDNDDVPAIIEKKSESENKQELETEVPLTGPRFEL